jgi:hypothetical protein
MNKNLLGVSAKIGSGKDTFFEILQKKTNNAYENKKFAGKLKQIASIITGIPVEKFEDQDFKNTFLSDEWSYTQKEDFVSFDDCVSKKMTVRYFLQKLGTEAMRDNLHTNVWVNALFSNYKPKYSKYIFDLDMLSFEEMIVKRNNFEYHASWCITDVRFPNEFDSIKSRNGILIRINRPGIVQNDHASETSLDNHKFDYVIDNNGTIEDFEKKIEDFLIHFNIIS